MPGHDVVRFANGLSEKLASRSRHVCLFLGAGASRACGLPDVAGLEKHLRETLDGDERATFERLLAGRNLEQVLTRLRRISALLTGSGDKVDGLTAKNASELDLAICRIIITQLAVDRADLAPMFSLGAWAARADYHRALELFTVNYDLLIETGLEALGVPYFDGFVGALSARFRSDLVEGGLGAEDGSIPSFFVRLWKLHGSVHWAWTEGEHPAVIRLGGAVPDDAPAAIYPSDAKYDESRRVPFVVLQDRLRRSLDSPETLVLINGYAFGDQHLNEILFDAARRRPRSELIAFCYSAIPEELAAVASASPNIQVVARKEAILGGLRHDWAKPDEAPGDVWIDDDFLLGDFTHFGSYLARSSPPRRELEARLSELLAKAATPGA